MPKSMSLEVFAAVELGTALITRQGPARAGHDNPIGTGSVNGHVVLLCILDQAIGR